MKQWTQWALAVSLAASVPTAAAGQETAGPIKGTRATAERAAVVDFTEMARTHALAPLVSKRPRLLPEPEMPRRARIDPRLLPAPAPAAPALAPGAPLAAPLVPTLAANFLGQPDTDGVIPPDTMGAAGPSHLVVATNQAIRVETRTGTLLSEVPLDTFWNPVNPIASGSFAFDPKVLYDKFNSRWILTACADAEAASSGVLIAVSATSDPTGTWFLYKKDADAANLLWADYPSFGFNKDWIIVQVNMFAMPLPGPEQYDHGQVFVFDKANLYAHGAGNVTILNDNQMFSAAPAVTFDNTLSTMYLLEDWNGPAGQMRLSRITGTVGAEMLNASAATFFSVAATWEDFPPVENFAPQLGTSSKIDNNDARVQDLVYRNGTLWATHTVFLPTGVPTRSAVQWWQITPAGSVTQRARIDDPSGTLFFAFPSIAVNVSNDALLGYSRFSASQFASGNYAFRASTDPLNTFQADTVLKAGEATYFKTFSGTANRWGDYSATSVDPVNDTDFWTTQEYAGTPNNGFDRWATWWGKIVPFASTVSINDVTATEGNAGTKTFTFTVTQTPSSVSTVTVQYATADGTAKVSDSDYVATSGTLTFAPGEVSKPVNVTVNGDTKFEANETFFVNLGSATNAGIADGQGQGTITNDDPIPSLSIGDSVVTEGNSGSVSALFPVTLSSATGATTTVSFATSDGTATAASGDYVATSGIVTIPAGSTTGTIMVTVLGDTVTELDETFFVNLSSPVNATITDAQGQGTIVNDDGRPTLCRPITSLPYTITLQGNYCLVKNLSTPIATGAAITINTDFVNLDLKGFKIGGGAAGPGTQTSGVYALNRKNITVRNGNIRGFLRAVFLEDNSGTLTASQGHVVTKLRVDENTYAGIHVQGRGTVIRGNQVVTTGGSTIFGANADAYGIRTEGAEARALDNDVTDTTPAGTGSGIAVGVEQSTGSVAEKNRVGNSTPNNSYGIRVLNGNDVLVVGNRLSGLAFGVYFDTATGKYRDNLATGTITPYTGGSDAGNNQ